ncbi:MAG: MEDS domain-containing protein, partial [Pseudonocardiaceae bacterium]
PGVIEAVRGLGAHDHVCWAYDGHGEFRSRAVEFLADGLAQGQRLCYVASGDEAALWDDLWGDDHRGNDLWGLGRWDEARRSGAIQVQSLEATYRRGAVIEPVGQMQAYAAATEEALAAGFNGLRVAADVTPLVRTPEQLDAFAHYEHVVDRYSTSWPFSVMCAYVRAELGEETIAQVACMHPNANQGATPFWLHTSTHAAAALGGELDLASRCLFPLALDRAELRPTGGELVIDAQGLSFIDHRSLLALAEHARRRAATAVLRTSLPTVARIIKILDLKDVQVEVSN